MWRRSVYGQQVRRGTTRSAHRDLGAEFCLPAIFSIRGCKILKTKRVRGRSQRKYRRCGIGWAFSLGGVSSARLRCHIAQTIDSKSAEPLYRLRSVDVRAVLNRLREVLTSSVGRHLRFVVQKSSGSPMSVETAPGADAWAMSAGGGDVGRNGGTAAAELHIRRHHLAPWPGTSMELGPASRPWRRGRFTRGCGRCCPATSMNRVTARCHASIGGPSSRY